MITFIRSLFESALKTNQYLEFAVITGCLRISRESGSGRSDIILKTPSVRSAAVILELKITDDFRKMKDVCCEALEQIEERNYEAGLRTEGYSNIRKYGLCFYRKECLALGSNGMQMVP